MQRTRHVAHDGRGTLPRRTVLAPVVLLGAVLYGCAFFVPAVGAAAGITVEIIKPTTAPRYSFETAKEYDFEAVAFVEGQELPGGEVSWEWSFGDNTEHVLANPCKHTFAYSGNWIVTVTARYGDLQGQDTLNAAALAGGLQDAVEVLTWPDTGGRVCDTVEVMCRISDEDLMAYAYAFCGATFWREVDGEWVQIGFVSASPRIMEDKVYWVASTSWDTTDSLNTEAVNWRAEYMFIVGPPPGEQGPWHVTDSKEEAWTPFNTVLTGDEECLIQHCAGETEHTVSFSTTHLQDTAKGIDPKYQVVLTIYDLAGNQVDQVTKDDVALGAGSITWEPEFGEGGDPPGEPQDADNIYAYQISADHGMCGDSWPNPLGGSVDSSYTTSVATNSYKMVVKYTLPNDWGDGWLAVNTPMEDGWHEVGGVGLSGDGLKKGTHFTSPFDVEGSPSDPTQIILTGTETTEDGQGNPDGGKRPKRPRGKGGPGVQLALQIILPTTSPSSHNVSFNSASNGVCDVVAVGTCGAQDLNDQLQWQLAAIPGSTLTSVPAPPTGAAVTYTYTTLPAANGAFGRKTLALTHPLVEEPATRGVDVFYDRDAFNHPNQDNPVTPNWYYYWSQTSASYGTHRYRLNAQGYYGEYFYGDAFFFIYPPSCESIDQFALTCRHEDKHREVYFDHWPNGYLAWQDADGDKLRDDLEPGMGYDPEKKVTYPGQPFDKDVEHYCETQAVANWTSGSAKSEDWAWPGSQTAE